MEDMNKNLNGKNGNSGIGNNAGKKQEDSFLIRTAKSVRRGFIRVKATKTGRIVITGTKAALMGLGIWKGAELLWPKKPEEPVTVVITPCTEQDQLPAEEEEPQADEAAVEEEVEQE